MKQENDENTNSYKGWLKMIFGKKMILIDDVHETHIDKQRVKEVVDKHTIKNADGEDYIACPPEQLKKELRL